MGGGNIEAQIRFWVSKPLPRWAWMEKTEVQGYLDNFS